MTTMITQSDEWKYWDNLQISIHQNSGFSDITLKWDTNEGLWVESQTEDFSVLFRGATKGQLWCSFQNVQNNCY